MSDWSLIQGSCKEIPHIESSTIDALVTDPPYEIKLRNNAWDSSGIAFDVDMWEEMLRVLKPGAFAVVFGHPKTVHRVKVAMEDAGFLMRDTLMWLYANALVTGKAVSREIDKALGKPRTNDRKATTLTTGRLDTADDAFEYDTHQTELAATFDDWHTNLRPGYEPIVLAQKPSTLTIGENYVKWGVGGLNIGSARVPWSADEGIPKEKMMGEMINNAAYFCRPSQDGRYPMNVLVDEEAANLVRQQSGTDVARYYKVLDVSGSRTFYTDKVTSAEREFGCEDLPHKERVEVYKKGYGGTTKARTDVKNWHPTVKPMALMEHLVTLVCPPGGLVLDAFTGSGSTGLACLRKGFHFTGVELSEEFVTIAEARLAAMEERVRIAKHRGLTETPTEFTRDRLFPEGQATWM